MTSEKLTLDDSDILSMGLSFVPTPGPMTHDKLLSNSLNRFFRSIRLRYHYGVALTIKEKDVSIRPVLKLPSTRQVTEVNSVNVETYIQRTQQAFDKIHLIQHIQRRNCAYSSRMILQKWRNHPSVIIKPADKNLGMTMLDRVWYENEMKRQLDDHSTYAESSFGAFTVMGISTLIDKLLASSVFSDHERKYIKSNPSVKSMPAALYGLPKIHKLSSLDDIEKLACRPIVSCVTFITTPLSKWVDWILRPLVNLIALVIKDSKTFVNTIESMYIPDSIKHECVLLVADISSLYTMIPIDDGLVKMRRFLNRTANKQMLKTHYPSSNADHVIDTIIQALNIILRNNYIEFGGKVYLQLNGTAMGQSCAVVFANIYVYELEQDMVFKWKSSHNMHYYGRFIDDVFAIISKQAHVQPFITEINSLHPNIQFNCVTSMHEAEFLDVVIYKGERYRAESRFDVRTHQKKINKYVYIPYSSFHTHHNKVGWIKAELIRYIRNTSSFDEYIKIKRMFYRRLRDRGYPINFLEAAMTSVSWFDRSRMLHMSTSAPPTARAPLCFISTLSPCVQHAQLRAALEENWPILLTADNPEKQEKLLAVMGTRPIVGYKRPANLANILVRTRYAKPVEN